MNLADRKRAECSISFLHSAKGFNVARTGCCALGSMLDLQVRSVPEYKRDVPASVRAGWRVRPQLGGSRSGRRGMKKNLASHWGFWEAGQAKGTSVADVREPAMPLCPGKGSILVRLRNRQRAGHDSGWVSDHRQFSVSC